ncbi:coiled-coil domain-containing protein 173 isoform X2 [Tyto alba]|uniref:coiled-coil domain-containing protein 173 isoform X2 n=1 Tax=Tyto alba TaxID=56313 RepID=UPI001C672F98|nr:coiled-coil domain-containing protein 173 isoform X2 [Tyto alba]
MAAARPGLPRGRRRQRQPAPQRHLEENNFLERYFLPNEVDVHQVIVLPKAEWKRIQDNLGSKTREAARILAEKKEREEMHLRSKAAVKDWPNTIMSALLLVEVLKERDAQVEFKKLKPDVNKKKDEEKEREHKEAILREEAKARERYINQQALRRDQLEQIKEHKHQADLAKLENKREGEEIQRLTRLYQLEIQSKMEKEQEEKVERQRLYHEHIADQKIIKAIEEQKRMEEDDRIKAHFKVKETIAKLIKKQEAEMRRLKQEHQDKIVSQLVVQMNESLKREDDRLARDIAKKEAEQEKKRKEKEAKQKAAIESIAEHRATVMKMKVDKEREEKAEGKKELNELMEKIHIYMEKEKAKKQRQRDANMEVQKIQIQQMAEKRARNQQEKQADLDYDAQTKFIALCKEQEFQSYAKRVIESESKTTHHLYPLLKASKGGRGLGHCRPFSTGKEGINSFQAQDGAGTQLPCSSCTTAQDKT